MASDFRCLLLSPENAPFDEFIFSIKFCEIFQGFTKKIPGLFQGFQGFPGLQKFSRVFQDFQGPYEPCSKCEVIKIGFLKNSNVVLCKDSNLKLGITFTTNSEHVVRLNYYPQLEKIQIYSTHGTDLSLIVKITIIKALAISKSVYLFTPLPNPDNTFFLSLKNDFEVFME